MKVKTYRDHIKMENDVYIREVLLLIMLQMVCISLCYENYIFVKSNKDGECPSNPCHSLSYYLDHPHFFGSNTTFYFLQGIHTIEKSDSMMIKSVSHLTFRGSKGQLFLNESHQATAETLGNVVINCTGRFGFFFVDTTSVLITSITLIHCGTVHVNEFDTTNFSTAITFSESSNIRVVDVVIQNSTGLALFIHNGLGSSQILESKFISNEGDYGGNVHLRYYLTEDRCNLKSIYFNIESSDFIHGTSLHFSPGFTVILHHSCVDIYINFDNVYMFDNINLLAGGGNIAIGVIDPHSTTGRHHIAIRNSRIEEGLADVGGGVYFMVRNEFIDQVGKNITCFPPNSLLISNTSIVNNTAITDGGGYYGSIESLQMYKFTFKEGLFSKNKVHREMDSAHGNIVFNILFSSPGPTHFFLIEKCIVQSGSTGLRFLVWFYSKVYTIPGNDNPHSNVQVLILDSQFTNNIGVNGGGLEIYVFLYDPIESYINLPTAKGTIKLQNCTFRNNSGYLGSSVILSTLDVIPFYSPIHSEVTIYLENVLFMHDHNPATNYDLVKSKNKFTAVVVIANAQNVTFSNCHFHNNNATGLLAQNSKIYFNGNVTYFNNSGWNGGALALYQSYILPLNNTNIYFYNNHATNRGGALFIQQWGVSFLGNLCFIQPLMPPGLEINIRFFFEDNTAEVAGHVLYGGYIDQCSFYTGFEIFKLSGEVFDHLFNYTAQTGISVLSSDPDGVCFCVNGIPICKGKNLTVRVFPGQTFRVVAVVVGQRDGVVPGVARAGFINAKQPEKHSLDEGQYSQVTNKTCTNLTFSVFSEQQIEQLELFVENPNRVFGRTFESPLITADLLECPPGFALSGMPIGCNCASILLRNGYGCNIQRQTIHHPGGVWIGCSFQTISITDSKQKCGVILHTHCPLNYCKQEGTELNLQQPDLQCALNHSGILCGKCQPGLSLALGTSKCLKCSNAYLFLLPVFLLVGLVLVVLLSWCNLTVSEGTLSALLLYVNIIQVSRPVFLQESMNVLTVFVAWLNLDLGIQTCFYNGMDMYAKAWLQFVFPLYIWVLVAVMIILSHYYTTAARLVGQNAPKVLATLFLFSYAKLLRAVITVFSFTYLVYPNGHTKAVWLHDGNVDYFRGKHIPLFITAVLVLMLFLIPYTFIVLFMQCLRRKSGNRLLFWVRRLKPIFDPYGGPYKDRYQFWTGLLLMARVVLLLAVAFNSSGNPAIIILAVSTVVLILLCILIVTSGVYKKYILDILEASFLLNLGTLSVVALYTQLVGGNIFASTLTFMGIALATFGLIVAYHIYKYTPVNKIWVNSLHKFQTRRATDIPMYVRNSQSNENSDIQYREMEIQPVRPPSRVNVHRLTYGEDGELMLVTDD